MGDFTEHILFGFLAAAVTAYILKQNVTLGVGEAITSSLAVLVGSVLPDIDHKKAYVHRAVKSFSSIGLGLATIFFLPLPVRYSFFAGVTVFLLVYLAFSVVKMRHRGFTHSFSFLAIITSISFIGGIYAFSSPAPGIAAGIGLLSHMILDGEFKIS